MDGYSAGPVVSQVEIGCTSPGCPVDKSCRKGCVDCSSPKICTSCEYGLFLFNTPENTVECVECPYFTHGKLPNQFTSQDFACATCLELPFQWQYIRSCTFSYTLINDLYTNTPLNTTNNQPELFRIAVDLKTPQDFLKTRYSVQQMTPKCSAYQWKNYNLDILLTTQDQIDSILKDYNEGQCKECQQGFILNDSYQCDKCSDSISKCTSCYYDPYQKKIGCVICETGYSPSSTQDSCVQCSSFITNCSACFFDSTEGGVECTACSTGLRPNEEGTACESIKCDDNNCKSCPDSDDVCEECNTRYKVKNGKCIIQQDCQMPFSPGKSCSECFQQVNAQPLLQNNNLKCLFCGEIANQYECLELCPEGQGYDFGQNQCVSCSSVPNCVACIRQAPTVPKPNPPLQCRRCASGYGYNPDMNECQSCNGNAAPNDTTGCLDCSISGNPISSFSCRQCDSSNGYGEHEIGVIKKCKLCSDGDAQCEQCKWKNNGATDDITCLECKSSIQNPKPVGTKKICQNDCAKIITDCQDDQCKANPDYNQNSQLKTIFSDQVNICQVCKPNESMNSSGSACVSNVFECTNSLQFTTDEVRSINPLLDLQTTNVEVGNRGFCFRGCTGVDPLNGANLFYDPLTQKCTRCLNGLQKCRNKITLKKYIYCNSEFAGSKPGSVDSNDWVDINSLNESQIEDLFKFSLDFTIPFNGYLYDKTSVYSHEYQIIFLGDKMNKDNNVCDIGDGSGFHVEFTSNIASNLFRPIEISYKIYTADYQNITDINSLEFGLYADSFNITVSGLTELTIEKIKFNGGKYLTPQEQQKFRKQDDQTLLICPFDLTIKNNMPGMAFRMIGVKFESQLNSHLIPKFEFSDLGTLEIRKFYYESKKNSNNQLTGFQMFKHLRTRGGYAEYILYIEEFEIKNFLLTNNVLFEIPAKKAYIEMNKLVFTNIIFQNSLILGDTSSGFKNGQQWILFDDLQIKNCQFFDSSILYIANAQYFLAHRWTVQNIHSALSSSDESSLIEANCFIFDTLTFKKITLSKTTLLNHIESPSLVNYYKEENQIKNCNFEEISLWNPPTDIFMSITATQQNIKLDNFNLLNFKRLQNTKINQSIKTYLYDSQNQVHGVYSISVAAVTTLQAPEYLIFISNDVAGKTLQMNGFTSKDIEDINILKIQNIDTVLISNFYCGQTYNVSLSPFNANCVITQSTSTTTSLKSLTFDNGHIGNIKSTSNPLQIYGYASIQVSNIDFFKLNVVSGVTIQPSGNNANVEIRKCSFSDIVTPLTKSLVVTSAALFLDLSKSSNLIMNVEKVSFEAIYSRYQAAGVYINNPVNSCQVNFKNITMKNVYSVNGGAILASMAGQSSSNITFQQVSITNSALNQNYTYTLKLDGIAVNGATEQVKMGYKEYFEYIKSYGKSTSLRNLQSTFSEQVEVTKPPEDTTSFDQSTLNAFLEPCAIMIDKANITLIDFSLTGIYLQQGIRIEESAVYMQKVNISDVTCISCSTQLGANILLKTKFDILDSYFLSNKGYSGAGLFISEYGNAYNSSIKNSEFSNNWVYEKGAGLYILDTYFYLQGCIFSNNVANGKYTDSNENVRGEAGGVFTSVKTALLSQTQSASDRRRNLASTDQMYVTDCTFTNNVAQVGAAARFTGITTIIQNSKVSGNKASIYGDDLLTTCVYGEGNGSDGTCQQCPTGQYSLDEKGTTCKSCNQNAKCYGQDRMVVNEGYWRPNNYSDKVVYCKNNPSNCLQGTIYSNFTCKEGYIGALCEACDLQGKTTKNGERYSVSSSYTCGKCADQTTNGVKVFLINVWVLLSMLLAVKGTLSLVQDRIMLKSLLVLFKGFRSKDDETGILIKMFTNYAQIIVILSTLDIDLPNSLTDIQDSVGNPVKTLGNALDCYLIKMQDSIPNLYFKILWQVVMNFSQFMLFVLIYAVLRALKKTRISFHHLLWTTIIYLLIYLQPSYVNSILESISCREVAGYKFILANVQFECYTDEYYFWTLGFLVPFLVFWIIILPSVMMGILIKHHRNKSLHLSETLYRYGFLYQEYKDEVYYWELVKVFQKTLIVAVIQLYSNDIKEKAIMVFEIVFIYGILSYFRRPYESKNLNDLDILSSIVCSLSLITGVFIWKINYDYWKYIGLVVIFLINLSFILLMLYKIMAKFRSDFNRKHAEKIEKFKEKVPILKKIFKDSPQSIALRKKRWKIVKERVNLYIDGIQAGSIMPLPKIEKESETNIDNNLDNEKNPLQNQQFMKQLQKQQSVEVIDLQFGSSKEDGFYQEKKKNTSKSKSIIIPNINRLQSSTYKIGKVPLFNSEQVLLGKLSEEEKELILSSVLEYRRIKRQEEKEAKQQYREYFIQELNILPAVIKPLQENQAAKVIPLNEDEQDFSKELEKEQELDCKSNISHEHGNFKKIKEEDENSCHSGEVLYKSNDEIYKLQTNLKKPRQRRQQNSNNIPLQDIQYEIASQSPSQDGNSSRKLKNVLISEGDLTGNNKTQRKNKIKQSQFNFDSKENTEKEQDI